MACHRCGAGIRKHCGAEDPDQGALPSSVRPEKRDDLACLDIEGNAVQRLNIAEALANLTDPDPVHIAGCYATFAGALDRDPRSPLAPCWDEPRLPNPSQFHSTRRRA